MGNHKLHSRSSSTSYGKVVHTLNKIAEDPLLGRSGIGAIDQYGGRWHKIEAIRNHLSYILDDSYFLEPVLGLLERDHFPEEAKYVLQDFKKSIINANVNKIVEMINEYNEKGKRINVDDPLILAEIFVLRRATHYISSWAAAAPEKAGNIDAIIHENIKKKFIERGGTAYTYVDNVGGEAQDLSERLLKEYVQYHIPATEQKGINKKSLFNRQAGKYKSKILQKLDQEGEKIWIRHLELNHILHLEGLTKEELREYTQDYKFSLEMYEGIEGALHKSAMKGDLNSFEKLFSQLITSIPDIAKPFFIDFKEIGSSHSNESFELSLVLRTIGFEINNLKEDIINTFFKGDKTYEVTSVDVQQKKFKNTHREYSFDEIEAYIKANGYMFCRDDWNHKVSADTIDNVHIKVIANYFGKQTAVVEVDTKEPIAGKVIMPLLLLGMPHDPNKQYPYIITVPKAAQEVSYSSYIQSV